MEAVDMRGFKCATQENEEDAIKKGPWTIEEDNLLMNYVTTHGEGRWNSVAGCAGLKRTGKSCRLRWLNYLCPDVRRGNISLKEQLMILELHSRWGNRWSKIAQELPGRTDNEIKNYWRTRVQKQAKQLKCDVNSKQFRDTMRYFWMPRLLERIQAATYTNSSSNVATSPVYNMTESGSDTNLIGGQVSRQSDLTDDGVNNSGFEQESNGWESSESMWNDENIWFLQQQLCDEGLGSF